MARTYGDRDRARGTATSVAWLIEEVGELYSISGQYDLLVKCNLASETDVGRFVTSRMQTLPNVKDTLTIITFNAFT